jgi:hypothetical protein
MLIQTRTLRLVLNIFDKIWKRFPIVKMHIFYQKLLWKLRYYINYILYIMYNVQDYSFLYRQRCLSGYTWGLAFYSHVESTCMTASFYYEGKFGPIKPA